MKQATTITIKDSTLIVKYEYCVAYTSDQKGLTHFKITFE